MAYLIQEDVMETKEDSVTLTQYEYTHLKARGEGVEALEKENADLKGELEVIDAEFTTSFDPMTPKADLIKKRGLMVKENERLKDEMDNLLGTIEQAIDNKFKSRAANQVLINALSFHRPKDKEPEITKFNDKDAEGSHVWLNGELDITKCPNCGGVADNGYSRSVPPEPYWCTKCETKVDK